MSQARILIADDQADVLKALSLLLRDAGFTVQTASSPREVLESTRQRPADLLIVDLNYARDTTSGEEGLALIRDLKRLDPMLPVIVMTAFANVDVAVKVMQEGARDFIEKPWDNYRLLQVVRSQLELNRAHRREKALEASLVQSVGDVEVVVASPAMQEVLGLVRQVGSSDATVLITGENGVGKGVVARLVHQASSRADRPMLTVDLGTLSGGLVEAELFGHEAGAFTDAKGERVGRFEIADGGTLFLDEIANCPIDQQTKLLRVIETGQFERLGSSRTRTADVRLICATNSDLREQISAGRFREDLYYRIHTVEIRIPPLRERREDILPLARFFLDRFRHKYRRDVDDFSEGALEALRRYPFAGNVRELAHSVERAVLLGRGTTLEADDLRLDEGGVAAADGSWDALTLEQAEKRLIERALRRHDGNARKAAEALGLSRSAFYRRLERHGLGSDE